MRAIPWATVLLMACIGAGCGSSDEGESGTCDHGTEDGPLATCTDPGSALPVAGTYQGRYSFGSSSTTYGLSVTIDIDAGSFSGDLSFGDVDECFNGSITGSVAPDGTLDGTMEVTGVSGTMRGTFVGRLAGTKGCGTWSNEGGQGGPWEVGQ